MFKARGKSFKAFGGSKNLDLDWKRAEDAPTRHPYVKQLIAAVIPADEKMFRVELVWSQDKKPKLIGPFPSQEAAEAAWLSHAVADTTLSRLNVPSSLFDGIPPAPAPPLPVTPTSAPQQGMSSPRPVTPSAPQQGMSSLDLTDDDTATQVDTLSPSGAQELSALFMAWSEEDPASWSSSQASDDSDIFLTPLSLGGVGESESVPPTSTTEPLSHLVSHSVSHPVSHSESHFSPMEPERGVVRCAYPTCEEEGEEEGLSSHSLGYLVQSSGATSLLSLTLESEGESLASLACECEDHDLVSSDEILGMGWGARTGRVARCRSSCPN